MAKCSLVKLAGYFRVTPLEDEYTDIAEEAGVKFIKVQHFLAEGQNTISKKYGITCASTRGFRSVRVNAVSGPTVEDNGRYRVTYSMNNHGEPISGGFSLDYFSDKKTMALYAYIPDDPEGFNRKKLAACYYHTPFCVILDKQIDAEIRALANEIEKTLPKGKTQEQVLIESQDEIAKLKQKVEEERQARIRAEQNAEVINSLRERMAIKTQEEEKTAELVPKPPQLPDEPPEAEVKPAEIVEDESAKEERKKRIIQLETEMFPDEIKALISKHKGYFRNSSEYKTKILPEIEKRLDGSDNTTTGNASQG